MKILRKYGDCFIRRKTQRKRAQCTKCALLRVGRVFPKICSNALITLVILDLLSLHASCPRCPKHTTIWLCDPTSGCPSACDKDNWHWGDKRVSAGHLSACLADSFQIYEKRPIICIFGIKLNLFLTQLLFNFILSMWLASSICPLEGQEILEKSIFNKWWLKKKSILWTLSFFNHLKFIYFRQMMSEWEKRKEDNVSPWLCLCPAG